MLQLLIYMNIIGTLFYILRLLFLPFEKKYMPPNYRILIYRLNLILFIIPLPACLFFIRRDFDNIVAKIPVSPFYYNGSHVVVCFGQNISFVLPKLNYFQVLFILIWIVIMILKYLRFISKNRKLRDFNSFLALFQKEEMAKSTINVNDLVNNALKELNIKKKPRVFLQDGLLVPHVSGIFCITLCLPCHWDVPEQVYYMVIKHELAHVRHRDLLFQRISLITRIVSWFNPILYLLCKKMEACEELVADACACKGASRADCIAYQTAILNLSEITSNIPNMPVKGFGLKRTHNNFTKERILTMKNKNLYKHKQIKLVMSIFISTIVFCLSIIPALAYNLPSALEIEKLSIAPIDTFNFNLLSSKNDSNLLSPSMPIQPIEDDLCSLFINADFSKSDFICIDENGITSNGEVKPLTIECNHNYITIRASQHSKNLDGSCTLTYYNANRCTKCNNIVIIDDIASTTYNKCPH